MLLSISILLIILGAVVIFTVLAEDWQVASTSILGTSCLVLGMIGIFATIFGSEPEAIDVYRGKTTLEITYKDSIAVDTVVVFKDSKK